MAAPLPGQQRVVDIGRSRGGGAWLQPGASSTLQRSEPAFHSVFEVAPTLQEQAGEEGPQQDRKTRLVVIGDSDFASNSFFGMVGNGDLFRNSVSWLAEDEELVAIGPKARDTRLVQLSATEVSSIFYITVIIMPLIVLAAGFAMWWRRR